MTALPPFRLCRLHLASRRAPAALVAVVAFALVLWTTTRWLHKVGPWTHAVPLTVALGAAAVIGVTTWNPFGEVERTGGRHLPGLRLVTVLLLVAATAIAFAAATPADYASLLRQFVGLTGIALLTAALLGARHSWTIPLAYAVICARGFDLGWTSLWVWPTRTGHDTAATAIAAFLLAAGLAVAALHGPRQTD
ncbi:hypothetical protein J4573_01160 [Actinomadura barringtoniae]|uniref:Uncharacterized protein n=1 Tax=Actinomadura barringtoniae TaxID=1427535 RepID=A0A939T2T2_9ACTN|nr:hypothetical protein [Actinomadura barringtoniae]MBO2445689.1 hypothetical protein [Actinomadura barringtoniae]